MRSGITTSPASDCNGRSATVAANPSELVQVEYAAGFSAPAVALVIKHPAVVTGLVSLLLPETGVEYPETVPTVASLIPVSASERTTAPSVTVVIEGLSGTKPVALLVVTVVVASSGVPLSTPRK